MSGHLHPLTWTMRECVDIYRQMGFVIVQGPEIDVPEYNFDRLNFPPDHPARDMHDTLWVDDRHLMRTHNSNMQIRALERFAPPVRFVVPGRVYRNERSDATHGVSFEYMEGFVVDRGVTMAHMLANLTDFAQAYFGPKTKVRFRPSYFPFVEPGLEMLVFYGGRWLEVMGAGMIHPRVIAEMKLQGTVAEWAFGSESSLRSSENVRGRQGLSGLISREGTERLQPDEAISGQNAIRRQSPNGSPGLDPDEWSGFAFGIGVDRFMMIRYGIDDVRMSYTGDFRFLKQFPGVES